MRMPKLAAMVAAAALTGLAFPVEAQFSDSYRFLQAVKDADAGKVTEMVNKPGSNIVNTRDVTTGQSALHLVIARRDMTWVDFLLAKGANPNATDGRGMTPLLLAAQLRFVEGARSLLGYKAQVDKTNGSGETPLIRAVQMNDGEMVRLLLASGANPDKRDLTGNSARDYAKQSGRSAAVSDALANAKAVKPVGAVQGPGL